MPPVMLANTHRQGSFSVAVVQCSVPETGSNQLDSVIDVVRCSRLMDNLTIVRFAVSDGCIRSSHPLASLFTSFSASESIRQHASDNNFLVCSFKMTKSLYLIQHKHIERVGGGKHWTFTYGSSINRATFNRNESTKF